MQWIAFTRSSPVLWLDYVTPKIGGELFLFFLLVVGCLFPEEQITHPYLSIMTGSIVLAIVSIILRFKYRTKEPRFFEFRTIDKIDYHAHLHNQTSDIPFVGVLVSFDTFNRYNLNDKVIQLYFRIYTYLDMERHFQDPNNAVARILRSIPLHKENMTISGGDAVSYWAVPRKYRTRWGLVDVDKSAETCSQCEG